MVLISFPNLLKVVVAIATSSMVLTQAASIGTTLVKDDSSLVKRLSTTCDDRAESSNDPPVSRMSGLTVDYHTGVNSNNNLKWKKWSTSFDVTDNTAGMAPVSTRAQITVKLMQDGTLYMTNVKTLDVTDNLLRPWMVNVHLHFKQPLLTFNHLGYWVFAAKTESCVRNIDPSFFDLIDSIVVYKKNDE